MRVIRLLSYVPNFEYNGVDLDLCEAMLIVEGAVNRHTGFPLSFNYVKRVARRLGDLKPDERLQLISMGPIAGEFTYVIVKDRR